MLIPFLARHSHNGTDHLHPKQFQRFLNERISQRQFYVASFAAYVVLGCKIVSKSNFKTEYMIKTICCYFFVGSLFLSGVSYAQVEKMAVSVSHSGADSVGTQLAFAVREAIRASQGFKLIQPDDPGIQVRLITINPDDDSTASNWTVATVVLTMSNFFPYDQKNPQSWYPIYLTSHVMIVGRSKTDAQARSVLASVDAAIEKYRREVRR